MTFEDIPPNQGPLGLAQSLEALRTTLVYSEGSTMTGELTQQYLQYLAPKMNERCQSESGKIGCEGRTQVVVMITDGVATDDACKYASEWQEQTQDFTRIIVSVGQDSFDIQERLACLEPDSTKYIAIQDFARMDEYVRDVNRQICPEIAMFIDSRVHVDISPLCNEGCAFAGNGVCQDGGTGNVVASSGCVKSTEDPETCALPVVLNFDCEK